MRINDPYAVNGGPVAHEIMKGPIMSRDAGRAKRHEKSINLALQGGGSHGAFTWGVLDRMFEEDRLWIEAISGTSGGDERGCRSAGHV